MNREEIDRLLAAIELLQEFIEDANGRTFGAYADWSATLQAMRTYLTNLLHEKELNHV